MHASVRLQYVAVSGSDGQLESHGEKVGDLLAPFVAGVCLVAVLSHGVAGSRRETLETCGILVASCRSSFRHCSRK